MVDDTRFAHIDGVARAILDRLGHGAPAWTVLRVGWAPEPPSPLPEVPPRSVLAVELGTGGERAETVTAHYSLTVPEAVAVAELAAQIQDHASEESWGRPLPPCPGHSHPLSAHVVDGVAVWECPRTPGRHREPIVR
jgi:hypothetical protein